MPYSDKNPALRFFEKLIIDNNECIIWRGAILAGGYGILKINSKNMGAHRFSYELFKGPLIKGLQIDHICRNRTCVNPRHLRQVTQKVNLTENSNSWGAINKNKTHCKNGHEFSPDNILKSKRNCRICKKCWRKYINEYKRNKRK